MDYTIGDAIITAVLIILAVSDLILIGLKKDTISERMTIIHKTKSPFICLLVAYMFFHWFAK